MTGLTGANCVTIAYTINSQAFKLCLKNVLEETNLVRNIQLISKYYLIPETNSIHNVNLVVVSISPELIFVNLSLNFSLYD